jgi:protein-S-isoprenylcysteine O-methyltransferase Ste14
VKAALGSLVFLLLAPGVAAGLVPWLISGWDAGDDVPLALQLAGIVLTGTGIAFVLHAFARFVVEGLGTPAPVAPPEQLVVGGVYRHVRNPMYLAVTAAIAGQAALFGDATLVVYAAVFLAACAAFVKLYEEPHLAQQFGAQYDAYRRAVPGWWPRLSAWRPDPADERPGPSAGSLHTR